jgi:imidazolonepropionase-like amidohydrolase
MRALAACAVLVASCSGAPPAGSSRAPAADLALVGATVYPSPHEEPIARAVVLIRGGTIAAVGRQAEVQIPDGARVIECSGLTLTAGFWNSHVHFIERKWEGARALPAATLAGYLREMLTQYGFTTVFDTGSSWANTSALRARIESGEVSGPRIFTAGEILWPEGALPPVEVWRQFGFMLGGAVEVASPEQARERARRQLAAGADAVKIYAATMVGRLFELPPEIISAAAAEAHRAGKLALGHPYNTHGLEALVRGGVDVLVHTAPNAGELSTSLVAEMRRRKIALIPTLKLMKEEAIREEEPPESIERIIDIATGQVRAYAVAGGPILFGTDVGYIHDYDPTDEYVFMQRAGMTARQILAALTTAPARRFGHGGDSGRVAPGLDADLVLLGGDPADDVRAFARVRMTIRAGKVIHQGGRSRSAGRRR